MSWLTARPSSQQVLLLARLNAIYNQGTKIMASLADITLAIQAQATIEQGVVALLHQLSSELQAAVDAEDPAAVQSVLDLLTANTKTLSDAVLANTPAAVGSATLHTPVPTPPAGEGTTVSPPADATPQPDTTAPGLVTNPVTGDTVKLAPGETIHPVTGEVIPPSAV